MQSIIWTIWQMDIHYTVWQLQTSIIRSDHRTFLHITVLTIDCWSSTLFPLNCETKLSNHWTFECTMSNRWTAGNTLFNHHIIGQKIAKNIIIESIMKDCAVFSQFNLSDKRIFRTPAVHLFWPNWDWTKSFCTDRSLHWWILKLSPIRPHWAEWVIESPCPCVCMFVCLRHRVQCFI